MFVSFHTSPLEAPGTRDAGGMNVSVVATARELGARGHEVTIVTRRSDPASHEVVPLSPGVTVRHVAAGPPHPLTIAESAEYTESFAKRFCDFLEASEPVDVVHSHYWLSGVAAAAGIEQYRKRHATMPWQWPAHALNLHTLGAEKMARGDHVDEGMLERIDAERDLVTDPEIAVCAASDAEASELSALYGIQRGRISILPPGVDAVVFTPIAHEPGEERFVFAVVGRIQPFKGQAFALEVFSRVRKSIRDGALGTQAAHAQIELRFVGTATPKAADNDYLVSIHDRINELGLDGDVTFLGALGRTETARELAEATLTLIPSLSETFGLVALESAACGTPVVTQSVGGLVESVQDGTSGLLLPDRDPEHWAETIVALLKDRARYRSMRTASRAFALDRDWQSSANRIEAFYRRLLSGRDGVPDEF